ncbi:hypothetical protein BGZ47_009468 [Haplosporangium gracile]|nr:hypothetical protein BGZ47_009468 [Haplosporangium gracile]
MHLLGLFNFLSRPAPSPSPSPPPQACQKALSIPEILSEIYRTFHPILWHTYEPERIHKITCRLLSSNMLHIRILTVSPAVSAFFARCCHLDRLEILNRLYKIYNYNYNCDPEPNRNPGRRLVRVNSRLKALV